MRRKIAVDKSIGKRMNDARCDANETIEEMALTLDLSIPHAKRLLSGKTHVNAEWLKLFCDYYEVSADFILFGR